MIESPFGSTLPEVAQLCTVLGGSHPASSTAKYFGVRYFYAELRGEDEMMMRWRRDRGDRETLGGKQPVQLQHAMVKAPQLPASLPQQVPSCLTSMPAQFWRPCLRSLRQALVCLQIID